MSAHDDSPVPLRQVLAGLDPVGPLILRADRLPRAVMLVTWLCPRQPMDPTPAERAEHDHVSFAWDGDRNGASSDALDRARMYDAIMAGPRRRCRCDALGSATARAMPAEEMRTSPLVAIEPSPQHSTNAAEAWTRERAALLARFADAEQHAARDLANERDLREELGRRYNDALRDGATARESLRMAREGATMTTKDSESDTAATASGPTRARALGRALASDAHDAAWRTAGAQFVKLARDPLVALLARHLGPDDEGTRARVAAFLDTEIGAALVAGMLAAGLSALPGAAGEVPARLARELRVRAMADAGDLLADVLMGPLREVMALYLRGVPAVDATPAELPAPAARVATETTGVRERDPVGSRR